MSATDRIDVRQLSTSAERLFRRRTLATQSEQTHQGHLQAEPGSGLQLQRVKVWKKGVLEEASPLHIPELAAAARHGMTESSQREYWLLPAFTDLSTALREPGFEHQGTMLSESRAALAGGFTTVCCRPDTDPVNDSPAVTRLIFEQAASAGLVTVLPIAAMTRGLEGKVLADMCALKEAGCVGVTNLRRPVMDRLVLRRCFEYARSQDICVFAVPEDYALAQFGVVSESALASRIGLPGIPEVAETLEVAALLMLARDTGVRLHLSQLSCARSVELVAEAKSRGLQVTADVALANLLLTHECIASFDPAFRVAPPLRTEADRQGLLGGLESGVIDAITTHHQPLDAASKLAPFAEAEAGMSMLECAVPLLMSLSAAGELRPETWIAALTSGPLRVLTGPDSSRNNHALVLPPDLVLIDTADSWQLTESGMQSGGRNCPWIGVPLQGRVMATIASGQLIYQLL